MATQIKIRRDTAANWTASNPTPAQGEPCLETDTGFGKFGDGATAWNSLPYSWVKDISDKDDAAPAQNPQTGATYTFVKADAKKLVTASNGSAQTYTVPPQSSVAWVAGTVLRVVNLGAGVVTFAAGAGVTVANTAATLAQYEAAQLVRTGADAWVVVKGGGLPKASVSGVTGSPAMDTTSRPGKTIYKWLSAGTFSVTVDVAGWAEVLVCGAGAGGVGGSFPASGGGGDVRPAGSQPVLYWLPVGTHTVVVGASSASADGGRSTLGATIETAGGGLANASGRVKTRAPGGMPSRDSGTGSSGDGAGGAGGSASGKTPGAGITSSITGSSVEYGKGGANSVNPTLPGQGGKEGANAGNPGAVIVVVG